MNTNGEAGYWNFYSRESKFSIYLKYDHIFIICLDRCYRFENIVVLFTSNFREYSNKMDINKNKIFQIKFQFI